MGFIGMLALAPCVILSGAESKRRSGFALHDSPLHSRTPLRRGSRGGVPSRKARQNLASKLLRFSPCEISKCFAFCSIKRAIRCTFYLVRLRKRRTVTFSPLKMTQVVGAHITARQIGVYGRAQTCRGRRPRRPAIGKMQLIMHQTLVI